MARQKGIQGPAGAPVGPPSAFSSSYDPCPAAQFVLAYSALHLLSVFPSPLGFLLHSGGDVVVCTPSSLPFLPLKLVSFIPCLRTTLTKSSMHKRTVMKDQYGQHVHIEELEDTPEALPQDDLQQHLQQLLRHLCREDCK